MPARPADLAEVLAARRREVLPVPYFHLVFTLPHTLHGLVAVAPRAVYELPFQASAATLTEFAMRPRHLGGIPAFSLLLHTWKQDLGRHIHVHALVAGGALAGNGAWITPKKGFLFPVQALSKVFRGKFVGGLEVWRGRGRAPPSPCRPPNRQSSRRRRNSCAGSPPTPRQPAGAGNSRCNAPSHPGRRQPADARALRLAHQAICQWF